MSEDELKYLLDNKLSTVIDLRKKGLWCEVSS